MSPLVASEPVTTVTDLAVLQLVLRPLAVVGGITVPRLVRPSACALTRVLHLRRSRARARVFGNRGHVPRPAGWEDV